ncbi:Acyl-CoA-binding protein, ACBP [Dillenia turbinata]|uniref:Acyl-CoA-binding protein, ACBP n=1 Tax=Dillenia turbinata TaxID=194707 RepID=A0AAN8V5V0_9MAGN
MELFQELLLSISFSLFFSIIIVKFASMASSFVTEEQPKDSLNKSEVKNLNIEQTPDGFVHISEQKGPESAAFCEIEIELVEDAMTLKDNVEEKEDEVEEIEELKIEDVDRDWVGIERTELERVFCEAVLFVKSKIDEDWFLGLSHDVKMELCALNKVAVEGPCKEPQPTAWKVSARAKWNAWQRLGNMSPEVAMEQYVSILSKNYPGWMVDDTKLSTSLKC